MKFLFWILIFFSFSYWVFANSSFEVKHQHAKILSLSDETFAQIRAWEIKFLTPKDFSIRCSQYWCFASTKKYGNFSSFFVIKNWESKKTYSINFSIEYPKEFYIGNKIQKNYQQRALSCEISATTDIMNFYWKQVTETQLITDISKSMAESLPYEENWYKIWGNPNAWFVWYIDKLPDGTKASQSKYTWYWVLEKPIEELYKKYGFETRIVTKNSYWKELNEQKHLQLLLENLVDWNMVQLWGDYFCDFDIVNKTQTKTCKPAKSTNRMLEWYYKDDYGNLFKHEWLAWEHAFYLLWYKWSVNNPSSIIVWDTMFWELEIPTSEWLRKWNLMQNRSIIIKK